MIATDTGSESVVRTYETLGGDAASDADLIRRVARRVRVPREDHADSFILHAPLEVLARAALLPWASPDARALARLRLASLVDRYEAQAPFEPGPRLVDDNPADDNPADDEPPARYVADLVAALSTADLDAADAAATGVARTVAAADLAGTIGDAVLPSLAAAGHAAIFLYLLPRVSPRGEADAALLRPLARELARFPQLRLTWIDDRPRAGGSPAALAAVLGAVPQLGVPGSTFIFPLMHQVDEAVAPELIGPAIAGVSPAEARPVLLRAAARAMVFGAPEHAPYGWSHALTMTQAAVEIAPQLDDPSLGVAVASTYLTGFLAALASEPLPASLTLESPGGSFADSLVAGMRPAAARAFHATPAEFDAIRTEIVSRVVVRHDAHLVKYTLACLDAMAADPPAARLYLAAAATLLAFWTGPGHEAFESDDPLAAHL